MIITNVVTISFSLKNASWILIRGESTMKIYSEVETNLKPFQFILIVLHRSTSYSHVVNFNIDNIHVCSMTLFIYLMNANFTVILIDTSILLIILINEKMIFYYCR